jgi:3-isopropylmalate/(R)-2-methylmalate dehydratase small subunit
VTVDLETTTLTLPDGRQVQFPIDGFSRYCLLNGVDQLGFLLSLDEQAKAYEAEHPARVHTLALA